MNARADQKRVLFIDQDGTLVHDPKENYQLDSWIKLRFMPGLFTWLGKIARETDYELVLVSNQDGLGTDAFPEKPFINIHQHLLQTLEGEGVKFDKIFIDRSLPNENFPTRKPGTAMLTAYMNNPQYDLGNSFVIGDRVTDVQLANNLGAKGIFLKTPNGYQMSESEWEDLEHAHPVLIADSWEEIYWFLVKN